MEKEKNKVHVTYHTSCQNDKHFEAVESNLHAEHKQVHKFTKVACGEREKITNHTFFLHITQCCEVVKLTYRLSIRECTGSRKYQVEKEKNKVHVTDHTSRKNDETVKSNLHAEHKQVHKFTKVPSGKREKQSYYHKSYIFFF